jgi:glycosyltransferase involved in cell wall biosynthesis
LSTLATIAFIGNSLPRRCGIATFTTDLQQAVLKSSTGVETAIVAMTDHGHSYDYPSSVWLQIPDDRPEDYIRAAERLNAGRFDVVCLQHEFGIFGGQAGSYILALLSRLRMPVVTTLHTVLAEPDPDQRRVLMRIIEMSAIVVVMAEKGRSLLRQIYGVPMDKIEVIPHGIPDVAFIEPDQAKERLGFAGRSVILTFGLLSPNKGIEIMIDAMPLILKSRPDAIYVVLGATHPNLLRDEGEVYREGLIARARDLGVEQNVVFLNQFVDQTTLLDFISMCDVYATPYLTQAQMTSGTLAYSFGLGKAVVSTPYWHASELLAEGRGVLVPFSDSRTIGAEIATLLTDKTWRDDLRVRAYAESRSMTWPRTAERYLALFDEALLRNIRAKVRKTDSLISPPKPVALPEVRLDHFLSMCDDTGLFQHAIHSIPDRSHGYCIDDNARALLLSLAFNATGENPILGPLEDRFSSFVQHAWNPQKRRFRNFMGFDRHWLEDEGSEDSHGRTLWSLGECSLAGRDRSRRTWATGLFAEALPAAAKFRSPRAWAFTLLGLNGYCAAHGDDSVASHLRLVLADRLMELFSRVATGHWVWFEEGLSYDNARLPQALIVTGLATGTPAYLAAGQKSLRWLTDLQTAPLGYFRAVGTDGFSDIRMKPRMFDQQPLEATATIAACHAAWRADRQVEWVKQADRAFAWFLGENDLAVPLADPQTGSCRDGLHPARVNENRGGESVLSYLMALVELREFSRAAGLSSASTPLRVLSA